MESVLKETGLERNILEKNRVKGKERSAHWGLVEGNNEGYFTIHPEDVLKGEKKNERHPVTLLPFLAAPSSLLKTLQSSTLTAGGSLRQEIWETTLLYQSKPTYRCEQFASIQSYCKQKQRTKKTENEH